MMVHDFDVCIPQGNEQQFIKIAKALKYQKILFLYSVMQTPKVTDESLTVLRGFLAKSATDVAKAKKQFDFVFAPADRQFFESKPDFIILKEDQQIKDSMHYRKSTLNQVHAELAKKNNITVALSFQAALRRDTIALGRLHQDQDLIRKYKLDSAAFSFATKPEELRSRTILDAFDRLLQQK